MILVGQYDSPFVRRVAVTMNLYGVPFTRDTTSCYAPAMERVNPLVRIPTLILDDGEPIFDSAAILDHLDEQRGEGALLPRRGPERRRVLRATILAVGAVEKGAAIVYERHLHREECVSREWIARCEGQVQRVLAHLEAETKGPWIFGDAMTQADVSLACTAGYFALRYAEGMPAGRYPKLDAIVARCEAMDAFASTRPGPDDLMPAKGTVARA